MKSISIYVGNGIELKIETSTPSMLNVNAQVELLVATLAQNEKRSGELEPGVIVDLRNILVEIEGISRLVNAQLLVHYHSSMENIFLDVLKWIEEQKANNLLSDSTFMETKGFLEECIAGDSSHSNDKTLSMGDSRTPIYLDPDVYHFINMLAQNEKESINHIVNKVLRAFMKSKS